jgi:hypothetical protein
MGSLTTHDPAQRDANDKTIRHLRCLLEGDYVPFPVDVQANCQIADFKEMIHKKRERGALRDIDAADLKLYKVSLMNS